MSLVRCNGNNPWKPIYNEKSDYLTLIEVTGLETSTGCFIKTVEMIMEFIEQHRVVVDHVCGSPDAQCDGLCMEASTHTNLANRVRKLYHDMKHGTE